MTLSTLIFDVDGTLADTEALGHLVAYNQAFLQVKPQWHWSHSCYGDLLKVTGGIERMTYYMRHYHENDPECSMDELKSIHTLKTEIYKTLLKTGKITLRPGVERLIREAKEAGLRLAIATTTTPVNVTTLLEATLGEEACSWFEVIAAGNLVPNKKPAGDIYQYVLDEMQVDASECLALEDSYNGVSSSLAAGVNVVVTRTDYTSDDDFTGASLILDHFGEQDEPCRVVGGICPQVMSGRPFFDLDVARSVLNDVIDQTA